MNLYTDQQGTAATRDDVAQWLAEQDAADLGAKLAATQTDVQAVIDGDPKLAAVSGLSAGKDTPAASQAANGPNGRADEAMVLLTLPTDTGNGPLFWKGVRDVIVSAYGGKAVGPNTVRVKKSSAISHLQFISDQLPTPTP